VKGKKSEMPVTPVQKLARQGEALADEMEQRAAAPGQGEPEGTPPSAPDKETEPAQPNPAEEPIANGEDEHLGDGIAQLMVSHDNLLGDIHRAVVELYKTAPAAFHKMSEAQQTAFIAKSREITDRLIMACLSITAHGQHPYVEITISKVSYDTEEMTLTTKATSTEDNRLIMARRMADRCLILMVDPNRYRGDHTPVTPTVIGDLRIPAPDQQELALQQLGQGTEPPAANAAPDGRPAGSVPKRTDPIATLTNPRTLPSARDIKDIADRAENAT
jgi:hypothetical protein